MVDTPAQTDIEPSDCHFCRLANVFVDSNRAMESNYVRCLDCGARGPSCETDADAIAAWNRHTPASDPMSEALERARPYVDAAVHDDGGIDHCQIEYRLDLEAIDAALSGAQSHWGGIEPHHYELAAKSVSAAVEGVIAGLAITDEEAREIADFVLTETFGRTPTPPAAKEGE